MTEPELVEIKGGWLARGEGWAVQAPTPAEARQRYEEAVRQHEEIDRRQSPDEARPAVGATPNP